jgi:predicted transcriptional regulator
MNTKTLTAHVPLPLAEKIDQIAARQEHSRGWVIKQALSAWVDQEEERSRLTREAMADADVGANTQESKVTLSVSTWLHSFRDLKGNQVN